MKILIPVDGSASSVDAVRFLVEHASWYHEEPRADLVYVQAPLPTRLPHMALTVEQLERYYREEADAVLAKPRKMLEDAGIEHEGHALVGSAAEAIVEQSRKSGSDLILIASRGLGARGSPLLGSTAVKVLYLSAAVPVMVVNSGLSF
jgi:nucleotide-binding universal stress UspA family protein